MVISFFLAQLAAPTPVPIPVLTVPMDLSATSVGLIVGAIVAIIGAIAAGMVTVITAWRTVAGKVSAIEGHVNSEKTASEGRELALKSENALLREMLNDHRQRAALLAQAASTATIAAAGVPGLVTPTVVDSLTQIDANTAAIEKNTAK